MNAFIKTFWSFAYVILLSACVDQTDDKSASVNNVVAENEDQKKSMAGAEILVDLPDSGLEETPWTTLEALDSQAKFHFAVVTDRTGGERVGPWANAMDKLNLLQPAFTVSVGDLIQGGTEDSAQVEKEWDELDEMVARLDAPFFYTPGNHDYSNTVMSQIWKSRLGADYYSFTFKDTLFIVLNSSIFNEANEAPAEWVADHKQQMNWLEDTLHEHTDVKWTFVFMHHPFWRDLWWREIVGDGWVGTKGATAGSKYETGPREWDKIRALLDNRNYTAFAGHTHTYQYDNIGTAAHTHDLISLATTGGGSTIRESGLPRATTLRGPEFAEFDHLVWVTMTDTGPVIANILLEGVLEKDFQHFFKQKPMEQR
jgi:hypothetical protein